MKRKIDTASRTPAADPQNRISNFDVATQALSGHFHCLFNVTGRFEVRP